MVGLRWGARTDVGRVRAANQDAVLADHPLFAVADGMGGHAAGEVAAATALEALRGVARRPSVADLVDGVRRSNGAVFERSIRDLELRGMGTTLCALALFRTEDGHDRLALANVGDSRAYLFRRGTLRQLTRDHSYVADLVAAGQITEEEALHHPNRNMLTRALGVEPSVEVDHWELVPEVGDRYLLCSDGLFNELSDDELRELLDDDVEPEAVATTLVERANAAGGRDNISVVVVDVVADGEGPGAPEPALGGWLDPDDPNDSHADEDTGPSSTQAVPVVPVPSSPPAPPPATPAAPRRRRFTWRVGLFVGAVVAVLAVATLGLVRYGRDAWFVAIDDDHVAIFRGHPGGFLWFDPTLEQRYPLRLEAVPPAEVQPVLEGRTFSSRSDAVTYVRNLARESAELGLTPTETIPTTTTTTTTTPVPTTPPAAPTAPTSPPPPTTEVLGP